MTKEDEFKATAERREEKKLQEAVDKVQEAISNYRTKLEALTLLSEEATPNPIMIEGETETGYYCQLMVDPRDAARIMLDYDYPIYRTLGEDAPDAMWERLGAFYGLKSVCSVDL